MLVPGRELMVDSQRRLTLFAAVVRDQAVITHREILYAGTDLTAFRTKAIGWGCSQCRLDYTNYAAAGHERIFVMDLCVRHDE